MASALPADKSNDFFFACYHWFGRKKIDRYFKLVKLSPIGIEQDSFILDKKIVFGFSKLDTNNPQKTVFWSNCSKDEGCCWDFKFEYSMQCIVFGSIRLV